MRSYAGECLSHLKEVALRASNRPFFLVLKKKIDPFFFFAMDRDQICGGYLRFIIAQLADKLQETASP